MKKKKKKTRRRKQKTEHTWPIAGGGGLIMIHMSREASLKEKLREDKNMKEGNLTQTKKKNGDK